MSRGRRFVVLLLLLPLLVVRVLVLLRSNMSSFARMLLLLRAIHMKNEKSTNTFADSDDSLNNAAPPIGRRMSRNLFFLFNGGNGDTSSNLVEHSVEHDGLTRWFLEYQPQPQQPANAPGTTAALVILLHGGGQSMYRLFDRGNLGSRRWLDLSDQHGFLLLAPNGVSSGWFGWFQETKGKGYWNDLREGAGNEESNEDDVGFLVKVIDWAVSERQIDPKRVYFTGASNGGMMTYRMVMERSDLVAAGAALIANLPEETGVVSPFNPPSVPTPMFIMNGSNDPLVPFQGGCVSRCGTRGTVRSSAATRDYFVQVNQAGPVPTEGIINDIPNDNCRIRTEMYASDTAPVQYNVMEGAGHVYATKESLFFLTEWFISLILGPSCREAESADLAWEFMSKFAK